MAWDVMSGVTKTAWDVLSGMANLCGMFCPGRKKMAWDVLSRDVLSGSRQFYYRHRLYVTSTIPFLSNLFIFCSSACKRYGFVTINL